MVSAVRRAFVKYSEKDREKGHLMTPRKLMTPKNIGLLFEHCDDDAIRPYAETEMLVRLYFAAVHDRMLLPGTTSYVTKSAVENVYHLEKLCELNWAHLVFNALKKACLAKDKAYMRCCVVVLLIVFADCIEENPVGRELSGRIKHYTDEILRGLLEDKDRKRKPGGEKNLKPLEAINFISWEDSTYTVHQPEAHVSPRDIVLVEDSPAISKGAAGTVQDSILVEDSPVPVISKGAVAAGTVQDSILVEDSPVPMISKGAVLAGTVQDSILVEDSPVPVISKGSVTADTVQDSTLAVVADTVHQPEAHVSPRHTVLVEESPVISNTAENVVMDEDSPVPVISKGAVPAGTVQDSILVEDSHVPVISKGAVTADTVQDSTLAVVADTVHQPEAHVSPRHTVLVEESPVISNTAENVVMDEGKTVHTEEMEKVDLEDSEMNDSPVSSDKAEEEEVDDSVSSDTAEKEDDKEGDNRSPDTTDIEDSSVRSDTAEKEDDKEKAQEGSADKNTADTPARTPARKRGSNKKSADKNTADKNTTVKTPSQRHGKRKRNLPVTTVPTVTFVVEELLPAADCEEICKLLKEKYNDDEVLNVGGTIMTGAQLLKCIEDPKSALNLLGAFVECLKWDDDKNGYNKKRIIIQPQHQLDEEFVQVIKKEIGEAQGGKLEQRILFCAITQEDPITQEQEGIVLFLDSEQKEEVTALHATNSKISGDQIKIISEKFVGMVQEAFQSCGYASPFTCLRDIRHSTVLTGCHRESSAFACMLFMQQFNGRAMPKILCNPNRAELEKQWFLGNLLAHEKNTVMPAEIKQMVSEDKNGKRVKIKK